MSNSINDTKKNAPESQQNNPVDKKRSVDVPAENELSQKLKSSREESARETKDRDQTQKVKRTGQGTVEENIEEAAP